VPGPACYGHGNDLPTVTDANLVLGYLSDDSLAGGALGIRRELAETAVQRHIGDRAGLSLREAAYGIYQVANSNMVRAIKSVSVERGRDPAGFAMMAFGGAGPIHAAAVARELGIRTVLIPPAPGVFSAYGLLRAEVEQHASRTVLTSTTNPELAAIGGAYDAMRTELVARLQREGYPAASVTIKSFADLRYRGQSSEITVPIDTRAITHDALRSVEARFEDEFERTYGHRGPNKDFELVTCRMIATVIRDSRSDTQWAVDRGAATGHREREVYFGPRHGVVRTPVLGRAALVGGQRRGTLIVQEYDTSVVVPPDCAVALDAHANIVIEVDAS
jgi:N-methylhydantoinase A